MMRRIPLYFSSYVLSLLAVLALAVNLPAQSGRQQPTAPDSQQKKNRRPDPNATPAPGETAPPADLGKNQDDIETVTTSLINVEAVVYHKKTGQIITGLKRENFALFEDGTQKEITNFSTPEAPITVTLVLDYSKLAASMGAASGGGFEPGQYEILRPAAEFLTKFVRPPDDYVSVIAYDLRPTPITDFTNDPRRIQQVISLLARNNPAFTDSNLFDALKLTLVGGRADSVVLENRKENKMDYAGMSSLTGRRKAVVLVATGLDTFSKTRFDEIRRIIREAGVPIYTLGTGELFIKKYGDNYDPSRVMPGTPDRMDFYQARNTLNTIAKESGGIYQPITFPGEIPGALQTINALLRNQYSLGFTPVRDGKTHKLAIKVDINGDGQYEEKDYVIQARPAYSIPAAK